MSSHSPTGLWQIAGVRPFGRLRAGSSGRPIFGLRRLKPALQTPNVVVAKHQSLREPFFNGGDLVHATSVAATAEIGLQPGLGDLPGKRGAAQTPAPRQHACLVLLAAVFPPLP